MIRSVPFALLTIVAVSFLAGCSSEPTEVQLRSEGAKYLLELEPPDAKNVIAVREAKDGDEVVVVGRVGGDVKPWTEGRAAFNIVDLSLKGCVEDGCETPWDYCCETDQLPASTLLIEFVDDKGAQVRIDSRELFGIKGLQKVVVRGKMKRDGDAASIRASGIYLHK